MCNHWLHISEEAPMEEIRHRVGIDAPITTVYDAVATRDGVTTWWTRDVEGESRVGGELSFGFGRPQRSAAVQLVELSPPDRVVWRCVDGPKEWLDTTIRFDLGANGDETVVLFSHAGWREPVEFMNHCSTAWAYFLLSLKHAIEGGEATPWPDNERISSWG
jgi:uncharacterized protein YndB with AHSA1/START domain